MTPTKSAIFKLGSAAVLLTVAPGLGRPAPGPGAQAAPARFSLYLSETLDGAVFLNAVSDNPRFNEPWAELRKEWLPKFSQDPAVARAFKRWSGRGIQLAYLLSSAPENDLESLLKRFDEPKSLLAEIRRNLDEPAYAPALADLEARHAEVRALLSFLQKNGFAAMRRERFGSVLEDTQRSLESTLKRFDAERFADLLEAFSGRSIPGREMRIAVLAFSNPLSFQLNGFAVGWGTQKGSLDWLLAHEFLHKFNPSKENLESLQRLAQADPFYEEAWDRVYGEFTEGKEDELVDAAARFVLLRLGLATPARNLRSMKHLYFSHKTQKGGVPLAAVLYGALARRKGALTGFDYNRFISTEFHSGRIKAGSIEKAFQNVIKPVSGMAGMVLREEADGARVVDVFDGFPAQAAGVKAGDLLAEVNGTRLAGKDLDAMLDAVAGESGKPVEVSIHGLLKDRKVRLTLK
ncbi:MAG: PDZ domain-containing protein [Elusimicrobia bacterium]|nr:PDZ domain-containing protein [Elusimicrobiota bacterium]